MDCVTLLSGRFLFVAVFRSSWLGGFAISLAGDFVALFWGDLVALFHVGIA